MRVTIEFDEDEREAALKIAEACRAHGPLLQIGEQGYKYRIRYNNRVQVQSDDTLEKLRDKQDVNFSPPSKIMVYKPRKS